MSGTSSQTRGQAQGDTPESFVSPSSTGASGLRLSLAEWEEKERYFPDALIPGTTARMCVRGSL